MSRCSVGARSANSTSPAIGVTTCSGPGAVMMPPLYGSADLVNFEAALSRICKGSGIRRGSERTSEVMTMTLPESSLP